ncbi:MAG: DUF1934 domain-containing protein [Clostridia bacterium]|nr:DUF1934 domain-containing protein [Clostridia bacterium]
MLKKVRICIHTKQREIGGTLFDAPEKASAPSQAIHAEPQKIELVVEGSYYDDGTRISISYKDGELTGMENSRTTLSFQKSEPSLITMTRDGAVRTALIFEAGRRHMCVYQTPYIPLEVAVKTKQVENRIEEKGTLHLQYTVELKGANAEQTEFSMILLPDIDKPRSKSGPPA